jgi:hypothetical protein
MGSRPAGRADAAPRSVPEASIVLGSPTIPEIARLSASKKEIRN